MLKNQKGDATNDSWMPLYQLNIIFINAEHDGTFSGLSLWAKQIRLALEVISGDS